jgi:pantetheine-phosphate adenylyltransferase
MINKKEDNRTVSFLQGKKQAKKSSEGIPGKSRANISHKSKTKSRTTEITSAKPALRIGLFPGTFDPVTLGHTDIINRSIDLFDKLYIGIGKNSNKEPMFSAEQRLQWIQEIYKDEPRVEALVYEGLTANCCKKVGAKFILRGIRYVNDFEYEKAIADMNRSLDATIETIFLTCLPQFTSVASTLVRDVIRNGGDVSKFLPDVVLNSILKH